MLKLLPCAESHLLRKKSSCLFVFMKKTTTKFKNIFITIQTLLKIYENNRFMIKIIIVYLFLTVFIEFRL